MFDDKEYYLFKKRGIILIEGKDRFNFIQGIISNDIELLRKSLEFYIKNSEDLSSAEESKASLLFHRLGRMEIK